MLENESGNRKARSILTKAYEISYALFRIASQIAEKDFAEQLRISATALLAKTASGNYGSAGKSLEVAECLVKFAGDVNIISINNSDVVLREIYALDAAIAEFKKRPKTDELNIAEIFSKPEVMTKSANGNPANHSAKKSEPAKVNNPAKIEPAIVNPAIAESESGNPAKQETNPAMEDPANINAILKSAIRQTAILDKIRQSGNCRLKDISEVLPGASERTLRYDLQTLLEQDLIERVGIAGPSVYYWIKQGA